MDHFLSCDELKRESTSAEVQGTMEYGLLLEAIQKYPFVYDTAHKSYKDSKKKSIAWQQISTVVNCEVDDCMKAWKNLRDRFVKEKNKLSAGSEAPESSWPYYEAMLFYQRYSKPRSKYTIKKQKRTADSKVWSAPDIGPESSTAVSEDEAIPGPSASQSPNSTVATTTPIVQRKRKRATAIGARRVLPRNVNSTFVEYLYYELQNLPEEEAKKKRQKILMLMFD